MNKEIHQSDDSYRPQREGGAMKDDQRDELISRVVDGCAGADDWNQFRQIAAEDQQIWSDLAVAQSQYEGLCETMHSAAATADSVELPGGMIRHAQHQQRFEFVSRWGGWAAAAAILLVWVTSMGNSQTNPDAQRQNAGMVPIGSNTMLQSATPEQAMDQYIAAGYQAGRVVGEIPNPILVETRPMDDGTFEVLYIRQILERKILDEVYRETNDEFGNSIPVPIQDAPKQVRSF